MTSARPAASGLLVRGAGVAAALALLAGCTSDDPDGPSEPSVADSPATSESPTASESPSGSGDSPTATPTTEASEASEAPDPVSVLGVAAQTHTGDRLRIRGVRESTGSFTSYDVVWRVRSTGPGADGKPLRLTGVLNVPRTGERGGDGPFPAVVLAHGYVDPAVYKSGQGMTRERGFLAERGFVALHVDYRGHAGSSPDPSNGTDARLGYAVDVVGAMDALRRSDLPRVPVDDERVAVFGRSMGGGVVQKVAEIVPDDVGAVIGWASVSSLEAQNFNHFIRGDADTRRERIVRRRGLPEDEPGFWRDVSSRPYFDRITAPVLSIHGRYDDSCPPRWARATQRAMVAAGVDAELEWYEDGHAFGPQFVAAMDSVVEFLRTELG